MKATFCISGVVALLLLALVFTGLADSGDAINSALREGNLAYAAADYETALALYEAALEKSPQNAALHFNAAQAARQLGEDEKAIEHYGQSGDSVDRFLSVGNIHFRAAGATEEMDGGVQAYALALEAYQEGIEKYPENVPLKYNYELVRAKLDELSQSAEQEQDGEGEQQDGEEGESQESQENQEGEEGQENQQSQAQGEEENGEEQQDSAQSDSDGQEEAQPQEGDQQTGEPGEGAQTAELGEGEETEGLEREAIERILQMLESREEESLKNNREVVGGNEDKNGW